MHLWPEVNLSSQLKQSPCARLLCISSQDSLLTGEVFVVVGRASGVRIGSGGLVAVRFVFGVVVVCPSCEPNL